MTTPAEENFLTTSNKCWDIMATTAPSSNKYIILDSGCQHYISFSETDFIDIHKFHKNDQPYVKMADDNMQLPIAGYWTIQLRFDTKSIQVSSTICP